MLRGWPVKLKPSLREFYAIQPGKSPGLHHICWGLPVHACTDQYYEAIVVSVKLDERRSTSRSEPLMYCFIATPATTHTLCNLIYQPKYSVSIQRLPGRDWKRRPGRPNNRWVDQIRNDTGNIPSTLRRSAILRGHGTAVTQRSSPATRT